MALTDFAVKPLRRVIPGFFRLDIASLLVALGFEFLLQFLLFLIAGGSPAQNPGVYPVLLFLAFVKLIRLSVYVFIGAVIIQVVLSWVAPHHPVAPFFMALTRPLMRPFQRAVPPIGGVDITPVLVLIVLQLIIILPVAWLEHETGRMLARALL
jgi:YggT family protein